MARKHLAWVAFAILQGPLLAATLTIEGRVTNESTKEPLEFGTVILLEAKFKTRIQPNGTYRAQVASPGEYTIQISSPGLKTLKQSIRIEKNTTQNFVLSLPVVRARTVKLRTERDIQKLGRSTLTVEQLKEAPATLGDALSALATLPGVIRPGGFFGPLIIRGAGDKANRYFIDDIPVPNPQHFGGLQSIISNDLMREVDLYASAFPAQFGGAVGAIIDIQTIDEVKNFGGVIDVSLISSNFLIKNKWGESSDGDLKIQEANQDGSTGEIPPTKKNAATGYWIASGRIGYLSLMVPPIYKFITGKTLDRLPEYYDYQLKGKVFLDDAGKHSLSALFFGSYDTMRFVRNLNEEEKAKKREEGSDPMLSNFSLSNDVSSHSQGLYYDFHASPTLENRLVLYNTLTYSYFYADLGLGSFFSPINLNIRPNIFGLKDKVKWDWSSFATLRAAAEYNLYYFQSTGRTQQQTGALSATGMPDIGNSALYVSVPVNVHEMNSLVAGYVENKFQWGGLRFVPGLRSDFLTLSRIATLDPRALLSYTFPSETTISAAAGQYQSHPQINTFYFNGVFNNVAQISAAANLQPERARHSTLGLEQKMNAWIVKLEGFANTFDRLVESYASSAGAVFKNTGEMRTQGVEVFVRKDREDKEREFFGWMSYTFTRAEDKSFGRWGRFEYEQPHSIKLVAGYRWGAHTLAAQVQVYSGFPYTNIVNSVCTGGVYTCATPNDTRYSPIYSANAYGARFPISHRLDLRYTHKSAFSWGYFSWYIEIINVYNYVAANQQKWNYNQPYSATNPKIIVPEGAITIIPYVGLEWRF